ncbi:MAG: ATP-binding protein [Elusimicrobia bacterium]|nr:ATP-binding protein [Elusimicrobiota bacterium]
MYNRKQCLSKLGEESCFLWGARQTGKSTLLRKLFPDSPRYDLLLSDEYGRLGSHPSLLREELLARPPGRGPVVIDEVQKIPALLDEVQWLIVNQKIQFILCGSSARKLRRGGGNLLGGRALRYELFPLVYPEVPDFDLMRALNNGMLPRHYRAENPRDMIRAYVGEYLKEEIAAEALARSIPAFSRFLEAAAFSNGEVISFQNIASECGVSGPTAREYFQILEDTLIGRFIQSFQKRPKRRVVQSPRFYFFDVGLANFLLKRGEIAPRSEAFGKAFEHLISQELSAHSHYSGLHYPIAYWRTSSQFEVDFILGDHEVAVEIKGSEQVLSHHLRGIRAFQEEYKIKRGIVVSMDPRPRKVDGLDILPWEDFLKRLWGGEILS